ncbi:hypothetical protein PAXRUDRAFT_447608 [Paxillus rubicundulus Ve08.2h10]|uniref:Uncharacterized protein n=1 Tax=Paxillus rubicundulus Ve08.2h10 TaxID=930991 RepID=A0A0D0E803_9AGAM|nr:hypothetical protein PAXRUDRAFT_447608 [Paxillus rubicundulus Ve08.2h10]
MGRRCASRSGLKVARAKVALLQGCLHSGKILSFEKRQRPRMAGRTKPEWGEKAGPLKSTRPTYIPTGYLLQNAREKLSVEGGPY